MYYRSVLTLGQWENNRGWVCLATPAHAITTFNQTKLCMQTLFGYKKRLPAYELG